jgi:hypothetical protein
MEFIAREMQQISEDARSVSDDADAQARIFVRAHRLHLLAEEVLFPSAPQEAGEGN